MLTVRADEASLKKLTKMLGRAPEGARVRILEKICGVGWGGLRATFSLSVGTGAEPGDEVCVVGGVPFVASGFVRMRSGDTFEVRRDWFVFRVEAAGRGLWN